MRHGNIIGLRAGLVGLDEACSGIRSLQAVLMLMLFFGELYRASLQHRYALVIVGALIAFAGNAVRTISLAMLAAKHGIESIAVWHDPIGYALMTASFIAVAGAARIIAGPLPKLPAAISSRQVRYPYLLLVSLGGWILLIFISTEIWYREHIRLLTRRNGRFHGRFTKQISLTYPPQNRKRMRFHLTKDAVPCGQMRTAVVG